MTAVRESSPGHNGGERVLSPLHQPCADPLSPFMWKFILRNPSSCGTRCAVLLLQQTLTNAALYFTVSEDTTSEEEEVLSFRNRNSSKSNKQTRGFQNITTTCNYSCQNHFQVFSIFSIFASKETLFIQ